MMTLVIVLACFAVWLSVAATVYDRMAHDCNDDLSDTDTLWRLSEAALWPFWLPFLGIGALIYAVRRLIFKRRQ